MAVSEGTPATLVPDAARWYGRSWDGRISPTPVGALAVLSLRVGNEFSGVRARCACDGHGDRHLARRGVLHDRQHAERQAPDVGKRRGGSDGRHRGRSAQSAGRLHLR